MLQNLRDLDGSKYKILFMTNVGLVLLFMKNLTVLKMMQ
jgi:hypothetical protein